MMNVKKNDGIELKISFIVHSYDAISFMKSQSLKLPIDETKYTYPKFGQYDTHIDELRFCLC